MPVDITCALSELLARNRGPDSVNPETRRQPSYGVTGLLREGLLEVGLTFRRNESYCCMEWGCHLPLFSGTRWDLLRQYLTVHGVLIPQQLRLRLK